MNAFYAVLIQFFNDEPDAILRHHFISGRRETIKMFDNKSAERIIIFGLQFCIQMIVHIIQAHRTFNDIFSVRNLLNQFIFFFIILVVDLTNDLFQNILQCDESCHFAIFIQHDGNIKGRIPHLNE